MKYICLTDDYPGFTLGKVYEAEFEVHSTTIPNYNKFRTKDDQGNSRLPSISGYALSEICQHNPKGYVLYFKELANWREEQLHQILISSN